MNSFQYYNPAKIIFGVDALNELETQLKEFKVTSLLLIYSGDFIKSLGIYDKVKDTCASLSITFHENGNVVPNPKIELVRDLISYAKQESVDFVLAVGGGSAIDTAKAVAVGIPYNDDVWRFFEYVDTPKKAIPIGVISTLPASGSESSNCSIISNGLHKCGIEYDCIIPKFAIMNPEYTITLPQYQTSCGVADILSHLLERYYTDVAYVDTTDYMIEGAIKALMINGERLIKDPSDIHARSEIQCLAFIAHNNLLDIGRCADWGSHRIEHEISAQYGVTHGEGMAIISIAWAKYMAKHKPQKLAQLANRIWNIDYSNYSVEEMALILAEKLEEYFKKLQLKTTLTQLSIDRTHFVDMADRATNKGNDSVGHYLPITKEIFIEILDLAL